MTNAVAAAVEQTPAPSPQIKVSAPTDLTSSPPASSARLQDASPPRAERREDFVRAEARARLAGQGLTCRDYTYSPAATSQIRRLTSRKDSASERLSSWTSVPARHQGDAHEPTIRILQVRSRSSGSRWLCKDVLPG